MTILEYLKSLDLTLDGHLIDTYDIIQIIKALEEKQELTSYKNACLAYTKLN